MLLNLSCSDNDVTMLTVNYDTQEININFNSNLNDVYEIVANELLHKLRERAFSRPYISITIAGRNYDNRTVYPYTNLADFTLKFSTIVREVLNDYFNSIPDTRNKKFIILRHLHCLYRATSILTFQFRSIFENRNIISLTEGTYFLLKSQPRFRLLFRLAFIFGNISELISSEIEYYNQFINIQFNQKYIDKNVKSTGVVTVEITDDELEQFIDQTLDIAAANRADYTSALRCFFLGEDSNIGKIPFLGKKNTVADIFYQLYFDDRFPENLSKEDCKAWINERFEVLAHRANNQSSDLTHALDNAFVPLVRPPEHNRIDLEFTHNKPPRHPKRNK